MTKRNIVSVFMSDDGNREGVVLFEDGKFKVEFYDEGISHYAEYPTEQSAENAAEDWALRC